MFSGAHVVHFVQLHVFTILIPCCDLRYYDLHVYFVFTPICFLGFIIYSCYLYRYLFTYTDVHYIWCSRRFTVTRQVPLVEHGSVNIFNHQRSPQVFSVFRPAQSLAFCVEFFFRYCLFVLIVLTFYCISLHLFLLITPLVPPNFSLYVDVLCVVNNIPIFFIVIMCH